MTQPQPRKSPSAGWIALCIVFLAFVGPILGVTGYLMSGPLTENKTVIVPHGTSVHDIATLLSENGVIRTPLLLRIAAKLSPLDSLKAGEYEFTPHQSIADILLMMREGHSVVHMFTVAEGLTSAEITATLKNNMALTGEITTPEEGTLLPETYRYSYGDSRIMMVNRMEKAMQEELNDLWAKRDLAIPLQSPQQAVIMASIIEKETGKPVERPRVAGVFYNRLRSNMKLQSDPTVIYGIVQAHGSLTHDLTHDDLLIPSPYNTYTIDGLPPGPICNPGRAALEAALHPESNNFLYFVADGTGGHVFAHDLVEHNQNVTHWNSIKPKAP